MARLPRFCPAGRPVHIMQRGINRQACFVCDEDDQTCLRFLIEWAQHDGTEIHSGVWMTNPVHLLATPKEDAGISRMMPFLGKCDVCYFNQVYRRTGRRWEGRFKSCVVDIPHNNPSAHVTIKQPMALLCIRLLIRLDRPNPYCSD